MSTLEDEMLERVGKQYTEALARSMRQTVNDVFQNVFQKQWYTYSPDYYRRRKHGKWTIYNKDGMRVAWGLNEREANAYMKLLKEE